MAESIPQISSARPASRLLSRGLAHVLVGGACAATVWLSPHWVAAALLAAGCTFFLFADFGRWKGLGTYDSLAPLFRPFLREAERRNLSGASFMLAGSLATALLFPRTLAIVAILFLTLGDVAATLVGSWQGRTRLGRKSLEGSLACLAACAVVGLAGHLLQPQIAPLALSLGAVTATLLESLPWKLNDNFTLPVGSAAVMLAVSRLVS
jgi:dolichol kinase